MVMISMLRIRNCTCFGIAICFGSFVNLEEVIAHYISINPHVLLFFANAQNDMML